MRYRYLVILSLFVAVTGYAQSPKYLFRQPNASAPAPLATLTTDGLRVSGITPGAQVYGFTVSVERKTYYANLTTLDTGGKIFIFDAEARKFREAIFEGSRIVR